MSNTVMTDAMRAAGLTLPLNRRVWMWLKDHPKLAAADVAKVLTIDVAAATGALDDLRSRDMVMRDTEMRRFKAGGKAKHVTTIERPVYVYTINPKMKGVWELWPKLAKKDKDRKPVADAPAPAALVKPAAPAPAWTPETAVEKLTLTQCRELFNYLHKVFKE